MHFTTAIAIHSQAKLSTRYLLNATGHSQLTRPTVRCPALSQEWLECGQSLTHRSPVRNHYLSRHSVELETRVAQCHFALYRLNK